MNIETLKRRDAALFSKTVRGIIGTTRHYSLPARKAETRKYAPARVRALLQEHLQTILVAKENGHVAGFLHGHLDGGTFWIDWIGTDARFRLRSVASKLLSFLEHRLAKKAHKIWFDTRTDNTEAVRFFKKHGYKKIATLRNHWHNQDFFLWEKLL